MNINHNTSPDEERYADLQQLAWEFAHTDETDSLRFMLDHGLLVNLADANGNTLLMIAAYNNNLATARMLLEHGADVNRRNRIGQTPLGGTAYKGHQDMAKLLLEYGADTTADNGGGMTAAMLARTFGRTGILELLAN